jgi:hypothetical protein
MGNETQGAMALPCVAVAFPRPGGSTGELRYHGRRRAGLVYLYFEDEDGRRQTMKRLMRDEARRISTEFAIAAQVAILGDDLLLAEYGADFTQARGVKLPFGFHEFPVMSIGGREEFSQHLRRFDEDVWNIAGCDVPPRDAPTFEFA